MATDDDTEEDELEDYEPPELVELILPAPVVDRLAEILCADAAEPIVAWLDLRTRSIETTSAPFDPDRVPGKVLHFPVATEGLAWRETERTRVRRLVRDEHIHTLRVHPGAGRGALPGLDRLFADPERRTARVQEWLENLGYRLVIDPKSS